MTLLNRYRKIPLITVVLVVLVSLASIPIVYIRFGQIGLDAISIIASTFLSLALVLLYDQQYRVLRSQEEPQLEISNIELDDRLEYINLDISNFGGGPAFSLELKIGLYELSGDGPIKSVHGRLRRVESFGDGEEEKTRASSIRPSELNINFEAVSRGVISMGGRSASQDSLASILTKELDKSRDVIYGKLTVKYSTKLSTNKEHIADFSLKFTKRETVEYELMDYLPWEDEEERYELGG